ncbi:hypothetical protein [Cellulophaga sp. BC115SP]|uniref:hypothetical protein n=1 Tax=Cellulophaga sp. BC115SP TaxID=2683263 RepID=UPI0014120D2A|nr:hypothetical protein [Cellulophaga sp. BC115SP]NBB31959.1 hypothetical protein [Cellulophaga sp. BC115SP]
MKRNYQLLFVFSFICCSFFTGCKGVEQPLDETSYIQKVSLKEITQIDRSNEAFQTFLQSETFSLLKESLGQININTVQSVTFDNPQLNGYIINITDQNDFKRDIMTVYKAESPNTFTSLIRESNIINNNGKYNGDVKWYNAAYEKINEMTIKDNRISHFQLYTSGNRFSIKGAKFASIKRCVWQCTSEDFNCEYQNAKNTCESDALCDFACSFNPCAVTYVAAAVIACTVCGVQ